MHLTEDQTKQFKVLADEMIKFVNEACYPHTKVIIDCSSAELMEGVVGFVTHVHVKD